VLLGAPAFSFTNTTLYILAALLLSLYPVHELEGGNKDTGV
jgi:hypothetical protein